MSETANRDEQFQERFSSPLSFTLSSPPQSPLRSPSPYEEGTQATFVPAIERRRNSKDQKTEYLTRSIQPLVLTVNMRPLNEPWGDKPPRTQILTRGYLKKFKRSLLEELLHRYGHRPKGGSVLLMSMMIKQILDIEKKMEMAPHLAHRVVGLKALWGQQEPVRDYSKPGKVDTELGEEDQHPTSHTTMPSVQFLHRLTPTSHKHIKDGQGKMDSRVTPGAVANKSARFFGRLNQITNSQAGGQEELDDPFTDTDAQPQEQDIIRQLFTPNMVPQHPLLNSTTTTPTSLAADALVGLSLSSKAVDTSPVYAKDLPKPWGQGIGYLCCQCGFVSTKEPGIAVCQCCEHLVCYEECVEV